MVILALLQDKTLATLAVIILGFADPAAALVGRRFGRIRLIHGRSLEGSLTFVVVGLLAGATALGLFHPELAWGQILALAGAGALAGATAELFSRRIDDNLSIPVAVALTGLLVTSLTGG
jgi:dolichol kinase